MNQSFELLSSMSPKLKGRQKTLKKAIKILALKKNIRRSSIYDKAPAVDNEDLAIIEASTESSGSSTYFQKVITEKGGEDNKNGVIIIDSTDSEGIEDPPRTKSKKLSRELLKNCDKNEAKVNRIQEWLNNIDLDEKNDNVTFFSQVSTIYGDEAIKFDREGNGLAACSTFNEYLTRRFDELFVTDKNGIKNKHNDNLKELNNVKNIVIDETLLTSDESIVNDNFTTPKLSLDRTPEQPLPIQGDFVTTRKKDIKVLGESKTSSCADSEAMESMLDSLYGVKWRKKQNHVLPLSEPKKKPTETEKKILAPNTERIAKPSNKKNVQKNFNPATKKLDFDKLKAPVASPWVERLKGLVDSDSDNAENANEKASGLEGVKTRLSFCDDSPLIKTNSNQNTEQEFNINKTNFDESYLGESLEERIRKKMNNFKVPTKSDKKGGKNKNSNKENNLNNANKEKVKNKNGTKEKPSSRNDNNGKANRKGNNKENIKSKTEKSQRPKSNSPSNRSDIEISSDEEYDKEITRLYEVKRKSFMPLKEGSYSFLESLSGHIPLNKCDMSARIFRTNFKLYREELKKKLFSLYNEKVFDNAIPSDTELEWNDKLRNTAGLCYCKKITHKGGKVDRKVKIALSAKVLDSPDRLRDTLIHEMCHAGTYIVNEISNGHGIYWKNWAFKAMRVFPELPPIKRCHSYQINTKYTYKCTGCGYSFGRHSKSLDLERKRCGHCYGKFQLLVNKTSKSGETKSVPVTPRKEATGFALFVKQNYAQYKEPSKKHGDIMKLLSQKFSELKVKNTA